MQSVFCGGWKLHNALFRVLKTRAALSVWLKSSDMIVDCKQTFIIKGGEVRLKRWKCVQVNHHREVGEVIEERQKDAGVYTPTPPLYFFPYWKSVITYCLKEAVLNKRYTQA